MGYLRLPVQLALRLLTHEKRRLAACVGGIGFALVLMLLQMGFRDALLNSAVQLLRQLDADVIVIDKEKRPFLARKSIPRERLYQALSVPGVVEANPAWTGLQRWRNHASNTLHPIRIMGMDPDKRTFLLQGLDGLREKLKQPSTGIVDQRSRSSYGELNPDPAQIGHDLVEIVGGVELGTDFEVDGTLFVSEETYYRLTGAQRSHIEMALVKLEPNADPDAVSLALNRTLPTDVRAFTKEALIERDLNYWKTGTPISIILLIGVSLGMLVGIIICYQVLYTEVLDHLPEFATLKAMGYRSRYLETVVLLEAIILSALAVVPAIAISMGLLALLGWMSGLSTGLSPADMATVLCLSLGMSCFSAILALGKIRRLEPAELF